MGMNDLFDRTGRFTGRDVNLVIADLESERDSYIEGCVDDPDDLDDLDIHDAHAADWAEQNPNEAAELMQLEEFRSQAEDYCDGPFRDVTFIGADRFTDHAKEFAEQIRDMDDDREWPFTHIDWEAAADELKQTFEEISLDGRDFFYR
jgi:hypothetical protein